MLAKGSSSSKEAVMADCDPLPSPSSKWFRVFASKGFVDSESMRSPTSILDSSYSFSCSANGQKTPKPENKIIWDKLDSRGVGLVDVLSEEFNTGLGTAKHDSGMVLFGSKLKIQTPLSPSVVSPTDSVRSPPEFGIKTRNPHVVCPSSPVVSSVPSKKPPFDMLTSGMDNVNLPEALGPLSASDMELSEEYTCVISRGPNPRTTHIFDNCIVESCCGARDSELREEKGFFPNSSKSYPTESFMCFCNYCNKNLGEGKDIYMYRGEKAFCRSDCQQRERILHEGTETQGFGSVRATPPP